MGKLMDQINAVLRDTQLELGFTPPMCRAVDGVGSGPPFWGTFFISSRVGRGWGLGSAWGAVDGRGYGTPTQYRHAFGYGAWVGNQNGGGFSFGVRPNYRR